MYILGISQLLFLSGADTNFSVIESGTCAKIKSLIEEGYLLIHYTVGKNKD